MEAMVSSAKKNLVNQGYTGPAQQQTDVALLKTAYQEILGCDPTPDKDAQSAMTQRLAVGKSAKNSEKFFLDAINSIADKVSAKAQGINEMDHKARGGRRWDADIVDGPIKGAGRIYVKACLYGAEAGAKTPVVERTRDILRGTIVFEGLDALGKWCGPGQNILDVVDKKFKGNLLRVKNRFMGDARFPNLKLSTTKDSLEEILAQLQDGGLDPGTRDFFYRDLQMLVRIDKADGAGPLDHHVAELQVTVKQMLDVKKHGGHKLYKLIRAVTAYADVKAAYKQADPQLQPLLHALRNHTCPDEETTNGFHQALNEMVDKYRAAMGGKEAPKIIREVIDNSTWYKNL